MHALQHLLKRILFPLPDHIIELDPTSRFLLAFIGQLKVILLIDRPEEVLDVVLNLLLLGLQILRISLPSVLLFVVLNHQTLVFHSRYSENVESVFVDLHVVHDRAVFYTIEEGHLVEEGSLLQAKKEQRFSLSKEGVSCKHLKLAPEGFQHLLLLELALTAVSLISSDPQIIF